ncbi:MAG: SDR family oxidoreductase [Gemmataceae bacterium]|nr:SDR family oxidoreductase [Gemmataceae bacterium]
MNQNGKVRRIVITGCTRGLGKFLALGLAEFGHVIAGCGTSQAGVDKLQKELGKAHHIRKVDVADAQAVESWAREVLTLGPPDILVNNAAIINHPAPCWKISAFEFDRLIDVNIKGMANVIRAFVPAMVGAAAGVIVNLSSAWGRSTAPEVAPYCASKFAVEGLTKALAQELPPGMAAVPLNPGIINTEMLQEVFGKQAGHYHDAADWAKQAVPFLLALGGKDNGKSLTVPG